MQATLRPANHADIESLLAIEERAFPGDRLSRRSFRALMDRPTAQTIVAEAGGRIAGYTIVLYRERTAIARLYSIAIDPDFQGQGIGALLLRAAEDAGYEHDRVFLRLEVREDNERAKSIYEKAGYRLIGKRRNYYEDGMNALRYEKRLRGSNKVPSSVPYFEQGEDFTCGPSCLMMAMAHFIPGFRPDPVMEIRLWREATTVFMLSGPGGCEPFGMAVAAWEHGLSPSIIVSRDGPLFLQSVRSDEKRRVMELAQTDFRNRVVEAGIPVDYRAFDAGDLRSALAQGKLAVVLVTGYHMFGKKVPHWVLVIGDDGRHFFVHDPWVEDEIGETDADAANIPIPHDQFMRMARFGNDALRAAIILDRKEVRNG